MPFTLRLGPFRFDSRRGTLAVRTRRLTLESRTRSERRARKAQRARRRIERRAAQIEAMNAARRAWRDNEPTPARPPARKAAPRAAQPRLEPNGRLEGTARRTPARAAAGERPAVGTGTTGPLVISPTGQVRPADTPAPTGRSDSAGAGRCGERTADGTPCRRRGKCPPGTHATTR